MSPRSPADSCCLSVLWLHFSHMGWLVRGQGNICGGARRGDNLKAPPRNLNLGVLCTDKAL